MSEFTYGYEIEFDKSNTNKLEKHIDVLKTQKLNSLKYKYKTNFDSNQDRKIYLLSKTNLENISNTSEFIFVVEDIVSYLCDANTNKILYYCHKNYSEKLMKYWLIHIVLPLYLTLNHTYYFLHAGSINLENIATLFLGDSYAGKSTLTNFFINKGHTLVSDDKLATFIKDDNFFVSPSHQYHRPFREFETLGHKSKNFSKNILKLGVIYWITPVDAKDNIDIVKLTGLKKFEILRYATEMDMATNQESRFAYITKLANSIPVYNINIPHDLNRLEEVYTAIIKHNKNIGQQNDTTIKC